MLCFKCGGYRPCLKLKARQPLFICTACAATVNEKYVRKSTLYEQTTFAIKFVNDLRRLAYPEYFEGAFPIGELTEDLGVCINDFTYAESPQTYLGHLTTDPGTSRVYRVKVSTPLGIYECVVVTHESGLELFLIGVAAFISSQTAQYAMTELLALLQRKINDWWSQRQQPKTPQSEQLTQTILVRTPNWEVSLDGRFTAEERLKLVEHILKTATPAATLDEHVLALEQDELGLRLRAASRRIVRNESLPHDDLEDAG